ncbi:hypothetical protein HAX54_001278, partial [Datura stramonium]|nr:hypothetical protein [Datura stramonium]
DHRNGQIYAAVIKAPAATGDADQNSVTKIVGILEARVRGEHPVEQYDMSTQT